MTKENEPTATEMLEWIAPIDGLKKGEYQPVTFNSTHGLRLEMISFAQAVIDEIVPEEKKTITLDTEEAQIRIFEHNNCRSQVLANWEKLKQELTTNQ